MELVSIELPAPLDGDLAAEVAKQSVFAARGTRSFQWDSDRRTARVEVEAGADAAVVKDKLQRMVTSMVSRHRALPKRVLGTNSRKDKGPLVHDIEQELARKGFLRELGPGQVALSGPPLA